MITPAQEEARDKAWDMLKEHFENVIIAYDTEVSEGTDRFFEFNWWGSPSMAIGLCERSKLRMLKKIEQENDPE